LTVLTSAGLLDPAKADVPTALADLARELRERRAPANFLLSLQQPLDRSGELIIESDGRIVDSVNLARDYRSIVVQGPCGPTEFSIGRGLVSVERSSCRHKNCEKMGGLRSGRIICAPNRLVAHVAGGRAGAPLDALSG